MESPPSSIELNGLIIADTSAVINLNATGCASEILKALANRLIVVAPVRRELEEGKLRGRPDAENLEGLIETNLAQIAELGEVATTHFENLVVGPASSTLDDGEAATIAFAAACGSIPILDERKATRLCNELFPGLRPVSTVDLLRQPRVRERLGCPGLAEAVFRALRDGRMRVMPQHMGWVVDMIGPDRAAECTSLPNSIRRPERRLLRGEGFRAP